MPWLRSGLRLTRLGGHIALGVLLAGTVAGHRAWDRRPRLAGLVSWWLRVVCRVLQVKVTVHGHPATSPVLFVCNHVSWLDIPVVGGVVPARFVSKAEVRRWPLIGWLAARAGTLFLRRADRGAAQAAVLEMVWALRRGQNVVLFPEGTTTDGSVVRRFRPRMLEAALLAGTSVQPVALRFVDGDRPDPVVPFVGDDAFLPHLLRLSGRKTTRAEVTFLEPLAVRDTRGDALAARCETLVRGVIEGSPAARRAAAARG